GGTIVGSTTGSSVQVAATAAGTYTLTDNITRDGCPGQCTLTVTVSPSPTCNITGLNPVPCRSTNVYTSTVTPSGGTVTHSWSIQGKGAMGGPTPGSSVTVVAEASGSFTLTDNITRDGCRGQCNTRVSITPCPPQICLTKQIACSPPSGRCDNTLA